MLSVPILCCFSVARGMVAAIGCNTHRNQGTQTYEVFNEISFFQLGVLSEIRRQITYSPESPWELLCRFFGFCSKPEKGHTGALYQFVNHLVLYQKPIKKCYIFPLLTLQLFSPRENKFIFCHMAPSSFCQKAKRVRLFSCKFRFFSAARGMVATAIEIKAEKYIVIK